MQLFYIYQDSSKKKPLPMPYEDVLNWVGDQLYTKQARNPYYYEIDTSKGINFNQVKSFFASYRHNENDGSWTGGYEKSIYGHRKNFETGAYEYGVIGNVWVPLVFTRKSLQVKDNFGRIINVKDLYKDFLKHEYDPTWQRKYKTRDRYAYYQRTRHSNYLGFRKGPVPNVGGGRSGWWYKNSGNHCGFKPWKRDFFAAKVDRLEVLEEYGVTFKEPKKIPHTYSKSEGVGWKRTKIRKQWMRKVCREGRLNYYGV